MKKISEVLLFTLLFMGVGSISAQRKIDYVNPLKEEEAEKA